MTGNVVQFILQKYNETFSGIKFRENQNIINMNELIILELESWLAYDKLGQ